MNIREAMHALLDGKKIRPSHGVSKKDFIWLSAGTLVWSCGQTAHLNGDYEYEIYEEPNPYTQGTFAWAREEANRGRLVRRGAWEQGEVIGKSYFYPFATFKMQSIDATDWEVM